jgi:hypothetical protein
MAKFVMKQILVVGHENHNYQPLDYPFVEKNRLNNTYVFEDGVEINSKALAEFDQFFRFFDNLNEEIITFGMFHYRRFLQITPLNSVNRYKGSKLIEENLEDFIYVPHVFLGTNIYNNFVQYHPNYENDFILASEFFKEIYGFDAMNYFKGSNSLHYCCLFVAPIEFGKEWYTISKQVANYLSKNKQSFIDDRWIGFILERLFSAFIVSKAGANFKVVLTKMFDVSSEWQ